MGWRVGLAARTHGCRMDGWIEGRDGGMDWLSRMHGGSVDGWMDGWMNG